MAAEGYLPPVVTKFIADLSDLARGVAAGKALVADFAQSTNDTMRNAGAQSGRLFASQFVTEIRAGTQLGIRQVISDSTTNMGQESQKQFGAAGAKAASAFSASFGSLLMPLLVFAVVAATPAIATAIGAAISLGFSLGFIGLGAVVLHNEPALVAAATRLKETTIKVFKDAAQPLLGPLIGALGIFERMVQRIGPSLKQIFTSLAPVIEPLAAGIAGFIEAITPGLVQLLADPAPMLAFAASLPLIGQGLSDMFKQIAEHGPAIVRFIEDMNAGIGDFFSKAGQVLGVLMGIYAWTTKIYDEAGGKAGGGPWGAMATGAKMAGVIISDVGKSIGETVSGWAGKVGDKASELGTKVGNWASGVADKTGEALDKAWDKVAGWGKKVGDWFEALPGKVEDWLSELPGKLSDAGGKAFDAFFFGVGYAVGRGVRNLVGLIKSIPGAAQAMADQFAENFGRAVAVAKALPGQIGAAFSEMWTAVTTWLDRTWESVSAWGSRTYDSAVAWVRKTVDDMIAWWKALPGRVWDAVTGLWGKLDSWAADMRAKMLTAGGNMVDGLIDGFLSKLDSAIEAVKRAGRAIVRGFNDALGNRSPSKLFAEAGKFSVLGYVQGIQRYLPMVNAAWQTLLRPIGSPTVTADMRATATSTPAYADGPGMVHTTINIDGKRVITALTPAAQQRKARTGQTGLT